MDRCEIFGGQKVQFEDFPNREEQAVWSTDQTTNKNPWLFERGEEKCSAAFVAINAGTMSLPRQTSSGNLLNSVIIVLLTILLFHASTATAGFASSMMSALSSKPDPPLGVDCSVCEDVVTTFKSTFACADSDVGDEDGSSSTDASDDIHCSFKCTMLCTGDEESCLKRRELCEKGQDGIDSSSSLYKYIWNVNTCNMVNGTSLVELFLPLCQRSFLNCSCHFFLLRFCFCTFLLRVTCIHTLRALAIYCGRMLWMHVHAWIKQNNFHWVLLHNAPKQIGIS